MFISVCYLFLFADVLWSFYVNRFVSIWVFCVSLCICVVVRLWEYVCRYMLFISLCRCVVALLCEYVCKYVLFISLCRCIVVLLWEYVGKYMLFISLADVLWSFYGSMFVSISVFSFSLQMCSGPFMGVCL